MNIVPPISILALAPEIILLIGGCAVLLVGQAAEQRSRRLVPWLTLLTLAVAVFAVVTIERPGTTGNGVARGNGLAYGSLAYFVRIAALELGLVLTLVNWSQPRERERGEFLAMMLFSLTGLLLVAPANDLLMLFLAVELVSIPTYIMVVLSRDNVRAAEAGTKYFYLGALSAAIMAYGFSFLYGVAGSADLARVGPAVTAALSAPSNTLAFNLAVAGVVLSLGGLLFKIAAVPLHFYIADVYQGAASPVAGLLGFVPKLAGFVAIFKIVQTTGWWSGETSGSAIFWLLWIVAVASMCVGNMLALRQTNIKRLLAYSGIAHAGYMLVGVLAGPQAGSFGVLGDGTANVLYYVVIYGIANLGAFAVLGLLRAGNEECETLRDVAGLLRREPGLALLLALAMFTLMGLPPTPGFWGKLGLFSSAVAAAQTTTNATHSTWFMVLVIIAVLNTALAAAYYLRVIAAVLIYENDRPATAAPREAQHIGALLCGFLLLIFAFYPSGLLAQGQHATADLTKSSDAAQAPPTEAPVSLSEAEQGATTVSVVSEQAESLHAPS